MNEGWYADPLGRHELRYHDGERWTEHVADDGRVAADPLDGSTRTATRPSTRGAATSSTPAAATPAAASPPETPPAPAEPASPPAPPATSTGSWSAGESPPGGPTAASSGWSTRTRLLAGLGVLVLVAVSGAVGFALGAASDVGSAVTAGLEEAVIGGLGDVTDSGAVLSSDEPTFAEQVDGATSVAVRVARAGTVSLEVVEAEFDSFLYLYDENGELIARDDDSGEAGIFLSRIETELEPGDYELVIDSFGTAGIPDDSPVRIQAAFTG